MSFKACWWNPQGYSCDKLRNEYTLDAPFGKGIYHFTLHHERPATLQLEENVFLRSDYDIPETDLGSTAWARIILPADRFLLEFCYHDSAYQKRKAQGAGGGYWVAPTLVGPYTWRTFSREQTDAILRTAVLVDRQMVWNTGRYTECPRQHAMGITAAAIYRAVRIGGPRW